MTIANCLTCKNYIDDMKCVAFPDGIPDEIVDGENAHTSPLPTQENDIVYEPVTNPQNN